MMNVGLVIYKEMNINSKNPFRIGEVFASIDGGCRTRMTHKCFATIEDAQKFVSDFKRSTITDDGDAE